MTDADLRRYLSRVRQGADALTDEATADCFDDLAKLAASLDDRMSDLYTAGSPAFQAWVDSAKGLDTHALKIEFQLAACYHRGRAEAQYGASNPHVDGKRLNGEPWVPPHLRAKHDAWAAGRASLTALASLAEAPADEAAA